MSYLTNLAEAQARLAALEAAELKILAGGQVASVQYDGGQIGYQKGATLREVQAALREVRVIVQRLSGATRTGGAIIPVLR